MSLTHGNIISVTDDYLPDYRMVPEELKSIRRETPATRNRLKQLNRIIIRTPEGDVVPMMDFVVKQPMPPVTGRKPAKNHELLYGYSACENVHSE